MKFPQNEEIWITSLYYSGLQNISYLHPPHCISTIQAVLARGSFSSMCTQQSNGRFQVELTNTDCVFLPLEVLEV